MGVEVAAEPVEVEPGTAGIALEVGPREAVLVLEDQVMHLPELSLLACRQGCFMGQQRVWMKFQRKILEHPANATRIIFR